MMVIISGTLHAVRFHKASSEEIRQLLQDAVAREEERFEHTVTKAYAALHGKYMQLFQAFVSHAQETQMDLAQLYVQCATVCEGVEFLVYAHRAVAFNPQVTIQQQFTFTPQVRGFIVNEQGSAQQGYIGRRRTGYIIQAEHMEPLEKLLRGIKEEAAQDPDAILRYEAVYVTKRLADLG